MMYIVCTGVFNMWLVLINSSEGSKITSRLRIPAPSLIVKESVKLQVLIQSKHLISIIIMNQWYKCTLALMTYNCLLSCRRRRTFAIRSAKNVGVSFSEVVTD